MIRRHRRTKCLRTPLLISTVVLVASGPVVSQALAAEPPSPAPGPKGWDAVAAAERKLPDKPRSSRVASPDASLGKSWKQSKDRAVTGVADVKAFKILAADEAKAYDWKTVAALAEPAMPADSWIGNQCVMDRDHVAAVYAPRTFTNKPDLMQGGAFAAIVNTTTGAVTKLSFTASLAYFDPMCNPQTHTTAFTAYRDMNDPAKTKTRVITVDTAGKTTGSTAVDGQVTSAIPVKDGAVAARGRQLMHIGTSGSVKKLTTADSTPFDIRLAARGNIVFADRRNDTTAQVKVFTGRGKPALVASGRLSDIGIHQGDGGRVFLTGHPTAGPRLEATGISRLAVPAEADISTHGHLAVNPVLAPGIRAGLNHISHAGKGFRKAEGKQAVPPARSPEQVALDPVKVTSTATFTGKAVSQSVADVTAENGNNALSPALGGTGEPSTALAARAAGGGVSHDPTDPDRWCSISRNDVTMQALQPTPNQVEWAVGMAVRGKLRSGVIRQGEYRSQTGMSTIDPQGLFPPPTLKGGQRIPANVMLGILAQESNLWQAESGVIPGQTGSPLAAVDGYYGHKADKADPSAYWKIHWDKSDCGYGVGQVTDGMRKAGKEKPTEKGMDPKLQKAVAVDYASNIAASMYILADKWNEVHTDGQKVTVNNDDPKRVENWFTAAWNYNLGFNGKGAPGKPWGLGWYNNPANPFYPPRRGPFMNTDMDKEANHDAAHPQDWPYEEKVMGWSAWSIDTGYSYGTDGRQDWKGESGFSSAGFQPAWWTTVANRATVSPPMFKFCDIHNACDPANPPDCPDAKCYEKFWWNQENATWKDCKSTCGNELIKYATERPEPGRGNRLKYGEPVCSGAPKDAAVVASVPNGTQSWASCGKVTSSGSFQFTFYPDSDNHYEAKADLHQVGGGYGGHFWYTHTRDKAHYGGPSGTMTIDGTWTFGQTMDLGKVWVHLPDTGAQAKHANYVIKGVDGGDRTVTINADSDNTNKWISLGGYKFTGAPSVTLSNYTHDGTADADIAWGAVAFQPLKGTYVKDTIEADAFFDEDQDIDVRPESSLFSTPLKSRKDLYDWALKTSQNVTVLGSCTGGIPDSRCTMPKTRDAVQKWRDEVQQSGTSTTDHPDGHSIPAWMHYSNPYTKRPSSDQHPSWFGQDGGAYKMYNKATVSYIKTSDGKIVDGSQSVTYDDRTADTHMPTFVHDFIKNVSAEYGIPEPGLNYARKNLNVHDGATTHTTTNSDGILPGLAYQSIGVKPVLTDYDDNPVSGDNGQCVAVMTTAGGAIGYRPALGNDGLTESVSAWVDKVSRATGANHPVTTMAAEIRNMFFKPGLTGSIFGSAPPIWQELDFKSCADDSIRKVSASPVLRSSYMPNQYLYRNGKSINLDGTYTQSSNPVTTGDFYHFSGMSTPPNKENPYTECARDSGHSGNPWSITVLSDTDTDPDAHFCGAPAKSPDAEYTR